MTLKPRHLISAIVAFALSACATVGGPSDEELLTQAGALRLDGDQVKAHVLGKTEEWVHGGAYYPAYGKLQVKWRKAYSDGTWEVSDDGELCYQLPRWERRCHFYMALDGEILMLDQGRNIGSRRMFDGNELHRLGRYETGKGRKR